MSFYNKIPLPIYQRKKASSHKGVFLLTICFLWLTGCTSTRPPATTLLSPASTSSAVPPKATSPHIPTQTSPPPTMLPADQQAINAQLIGAAEAGDAAAVIALLQNGAEINSRDERGRTAAMAATHANQVDIVRALIEAGADINIQDNRSDNPFLYASAEGLNGIVELTIEAGADTRLTNRFGGTALIPAAERGHVDVVRELLTQTNVDVNHINNLGWTALLEAIILSDGGERHQQIVQLLMDHGANPNISDKDGVTPLEHARARGFTEIEQILLTAMQAREQALIVAAERGDLEQVRQLLGEGVSVAAQDEQGRTALIVAAYQNNMPITDLLIQAGANVNTQDNTKQSAYLISTSEGYLDLLLRTLQAGADVHSKDSYNGTGLIRAAERGHVEIIQELLKTDIDVNHINNLGWTALLEAIILGNGGPRHSEVVRLLVEAGADVNLADSDGITPLAHARHRGYQEIVDILVQAGAR